MSAFSVAAFRVATASKIHDLICSRLTEQEFTRLVGTHSGFTGPRVTTNLDTTGWSFQRRSQVLRASFVLWVLFNTPHEDEYTYVEHVFRSLDAMAGLPDIPNTPTE